MAEIFEDMDIAGKGIVTVEDRAIPSHTIGNSVRWAAAEAEMGCERT